MSLDLTLIYPQFNFEMTKPRSQNVYEFEDFRLDAAHLLLYQSGQEISLAPKVVETLLFLVENSGKVVSKDELMEKVWADSIVEESNLSQNLFRLRKILGETKDGKPFIETLRRRGYRFVPEVSVAGVDEEVSNPELNGLSNKNFIFADINSTNGEIPDAITKISADETRNLSSENEIQNLSPHISRTPRRKSPSRAILLFSFVALITIGSLGFALRSGWQPKQSNSSDQRLTENQFDSFSQSSSLTNSDTPLPMKLYLQMSEAEQMAFIREKKRQVENLIEAEPIDLSDEEISAIKTEIDDYVEETQSLSQKPFEEGLRVIYGRASQFVPVVRRSYAARRVPPALGIYQAMIESEYHDCLKSGNGAVGLFQFLPATVRKYGLTPKDFCNVEKQSNAAAMYMSDLISDFDDKTLALLAFNVGEQGIRDYLRQLRELGITQRNAWTVYRNAGNLKPQLSTDGSSYVPRFYAATIIGENPQNFDLSTPPLSTLQ